MCNTENQRQTRKRKRKTNRRGSSKKTKPNYLETLADEVLLEILKDVPRRELGHLALLSRRFSRITEDRMLWKKVVLKGNMQNALGHIGTLMRRQVQHLTVRSTDTQSPLLRPVLDYTVPSWSVKELRLYSVPIFPNYLAKMLERCDQLTKVTLEDIWVNNNVLVALSGNENLENLDLLRARIPEPLSFAVLLQKVTRLKEFCVSCAEGSPLLLDTVFENLPPSLLRFEFDCGTELNDQNIEQLVRNCPLLKMLELSPCLGLTVRSTVSLCNLKHLRLLDVPGCERIPPAAFLPLAEMENMKVLNFSHRLRDQEELRSIEELFGLTTIIAGRTSNDRVFHLGSFNSEFGVVKLMY